MRDVFSFVRLLFLKPMVGVLCIQLFTFVSSMSRSTLFWTLGRPSCRVDYNLTYCE